MLVVQGERISHEPIFEVRLALSKSVILIVVACDEYGRVEIEITDGESAEAYRLG